MNSLVDLLKEISTPYQFPSALHLLKNISIPKLNPEILLLLRNVIRLANKDLMQFQGFSIIYNILNESLNYTYTDAEWLKLSDMLSDVLVATLELALSIQKTRSIGENAFYNLLLQTSKLIFPLLLERTSLRMYVINQGCSMLLRFICMEDINVILRKDIFLLIKPILVKADSQQRKLIRKTCDKQLEKMAELVLHCGDFEIQESIIELLMRFSYNSKQQLNKLIVWFRKYSKVLQIVRMLDYNNFDVSCREFLNTLNDTILSNKQVVTLPCLEVFANDIKLRKPTSDKYKELWVDFSTSTGVIHMVCDSGANAWLKLCVEHRNVKRITCFNRCREITIVQNVIHILIELISPLRIQLDSSQQYIFTLKILFLESPKFGKLEEFFFEKCYKNVYKKEKVESSTQPPKKADGDEIVGKPKPNSDWFFDNASSISSIRTASTVRGKCSLTKGCCDEQRTKRLPITASTPKTFHCCLSESNVSGKSNKPNENMKPNSSLDDKENMNLINRKFIEGKQEKVSFIRYRRNSPSIIEDQEFKKLCEERLSQSKNQRLSKTNKKNPLSVERNDTFKNPKFYLKDNDTIVGTQGTGGKSNMSSIEARSMKNVEKASEIENSEDSPYHFTSMIPKNSTEQVPGKSDVSNKTKIEVTDTINCIPLNQPGPTGTETNLHKLKRLFTERNFSSYRLSLQQSDRASHSPSTSSKLTSNEEKTPTLEPTINRSLLTLKESSIPVKQNIEKQDEDPLKAVVNVSLRKSILNPQTYIKNNSNNSIMNNKPGNDYKLHNPLNFAKYFSTQESIVKEENSPMTAEGPQVKKPKLGNKQVEPDKENNKSSQSNRGGLNKIINSSQEAVENKTFQIKNKHDVSNQLFDCLSESDSAKMKGNKSTLKKLDVYDSDFLTPEKPTKFFPKAAYEGYKENTQVDNNLQKNAKSANKFSYQLDSESNNFLPQPTKYKYKQRNIQKNNYKKQSLNSKLNLIGHSIVSPNASFHCRIPTKTYASRNPSKPTSIKSPDSMFENLKKQKRRSMLDLDLTTKTSNRKRKLFNPNEYLDEISSSNEIDQSKISDIVYPTPLLSKKNGIKNQNMNLCNSTEIKKVVKKEPMIFDENTEDKSSPVECKNLAVNPRRSLRNKPNRKYIEISSDDSSPRRSLKNKQNRKSLEISSDDSCPRRSLRNKPGRQCIEISSHSNNDSQSTVPNSLNQGKFKDGTWSEDGNKSKTKFEELLKKDDIKEKLRAESKLLKSKSHFSEDLGKLTKVDALRDSSESELKLQPVPVEENKSDESILDLVPPPKLSTEGSQESLTEVIRHAEPTSKMSSSSGTQAEAREELCLLDTIITNLEMISLGGGRKKILTEVVALEKSINKAELFTKSSNKQLNEMCLEVKKLLETAKANIENMLSSCEGFMGSFQTKMTDIKSTMTRLSKDVNNDQDTKLKVIEDIEKRCREHRNNVREEKF